MAVNGLSMEKKMIILFGAGIVGLKAFNYYGADKVYCFADNFKAGQEVCGKRIISFGELLEIHAGYCVVIAGSVENGIALKEQCAAANIDAVLWSEQISLDDYESIPEIAKYKGRYNGKRCFLIGNAPSLRSEDLDKLHKHGEISFGCNYIGKIFHATKWRPNYYCVSDAIFLNTQYEYIAQMEAETIFIPHIEDVIINDNSAHRTSLSFARGEIVYYNQLTNSEREVDSASFSGDPSKAVYPGSTVMLTMIQFAAYMGFRDIYLLGVDGTISSAIDPSSYKEKRNFYRDDQGNYSYEWRKRITTLLPEMQNTIAVNGYLTAEKYSRGHGFRIYNATRGGVLEMFERVDFDSLF